MHILNYWRWFEFMRSSGGTLTAGLFSTWILTTELCWVLETRERRKQVMCLHAHSSHTLASSLCLLSKSFLLEENKKLLLKEKLKLLLWRMNTLCTQQLPQAVSLSRATLWYLGSNTCFNHYLQQWPSKGNVFKVILIDVGVWSLYNHCLCS